LGEGPEWQQTRPIDLDRYRSSSKDPYSHSNTNGAGNASIRLGTARGSAVCAVKMTVKVKRSSIGAGLRAIGAGCTFRDLSRTIGPFEDSNGSVVYSR
jgi:hypothetical protein